MAHHQNSETRVTNFLTRTAPSRLRSPNATPPECLPIPCEAQRLPPTTGYELTPIAAIQLTADAATTDGEHHPALMTTERQLGWLLKV